MNIEKEELEKYAIVQCLGSYGTLWVGPSHQYIHTLYTTNV